MSATGDTYDVAIASWAFQSADWLVEAAAAHRRACSTPAC